MIILGILLLILGVVVNVSLFEWLGACLTILGVVFAFAGRHYY